MNEVNLDKEKKKHNKQNKNKQNKVKIGGTLENQLVEGQPSLNVLKWTWNEINT